MVLNWSGVTGQAARKAPAGRFFSRKAIYSGIGFCIDHEGRGGFRRTFKR
jgi:hypothetical protein